MFDDAAVSDLNEETISAIDDDWNDGVITEEAEAEETETEEADQPKAEEETEAEEEDETTAETETEAEEPAEETESADEKKADELFELKHLGETKSYTRDEMKALAQKGLDYDRIRAEIDTLKAEKENGNEFEQFVKELAEQQKTTPDALIENMRVKALMLNDRSLTAAQARERVQADVKQRRDAAAAEQQRKDSFKRFAENHPDVKADAIPKEVWDDVHKGMDISDAYEKHSKAEESRQLSERLKELEAENKALKDNAKNAKRSTGSRKSRGAASKMSDFDAAWYDGT